MPDLDLDPNEYRSNRPQVISRKQAKLYLAGFVAFAGFMYWAAFGSDDWYAPLALFVPGIMIGALVTRLWPLFLLDARDN